MTKVIQAQTKLNCDHLIGEFLDESHYDVLIDEDCDFYAPDVDGDMNESNVVFKFRKNWFTEEEQRNAVEGLRDAARKTENRGLASGNEKVGTLGQRLWVTARQDAILDALMNPVDTLDGSDPIAEINEEFKVNRDQTGRGVVWSTGKTKDWDFDTWVAQTKTLPKEQRIAEATKVYKTYITNTSYGNSVFSGIAGYFDRYPRIPYLRETSYTEANRDKFEKSYPFIRALDRGFKQLLPQRHSAQMRFVKKVDPRFIIEGTAFSTLTINKTFRTAAHLDGKNLPEGFSNLCVFSDGECDYSGGYLVLPEFRAAVNIRPGDMLLIDNEGIVHGNTPIAAAEEGKEPLRYSLIAYFRRGMTEGGVKEYEDLRRLFVEERKNDKSHPEWREGFNGVSPSMWSGEEWKARLLKHPQGQEFIDKYHPEFQKQPSLEDFF